MKLTEQVSNLFGDESAIKVLSTVSGEGVPHSITVGSLMPISDEQICAFEIFMNKSAENMAANDQVAILVVKDKESYLVNATVAEKLTEGEMYEAFTDNVIAKGIPVKGLWIFNVNEVYDQSATPNAGTRLN